MKKQVIPIVLSADDNYVPMLGTAIYSILTNASKEYFYKFYILYTDISKDHREKLKETKTEESEIILIDISDWLKGIPHENSIHLSIETVYRLFIPEILPQYEKIIYLDCDLVVNGDISEFYQNDIGSDILGAMHDCLDEKTLKYWNGHLKLSEDEAFNAGVLLINTKRFQEEQVREKCLHLLQEDWKREEKNYLYMDQDVLNIVCCHKVRFLPMNWNLQWIYRTGNGMKLRDIYSEEYHEAEKDIKLLHFSSRRKPWDYPEYYGAEYFWKYARHTVFYEEIMKKMAAAGEQQLRQLFERYVFPYHKVKAKSKIILYGAGQVGKVFKEQMDKVRYCTVVLWVDRGFEELRKKDLKVSAPEQIEKTDHDYLVIAIENETVAQSVREELIKRGISEKKIAWEDPAIEYMKDKQ